MDSPDKANPKDDWAKKPIEIAPKDLADVLEEIWDLKTTKPKSPSKPNTSLPKKSTEKEEQWEKIKSRMALFPSHFGYSMERYPPHLDRRYEPTKKEKEMTAEERERLMRQVEKKIMEMKSVF